MMNLFTWQLLAVLLLAALLGFLIGVSGARLHQLRNNRVAKRSGNTAFGKVTSERDKLLSEQSSMKKALESEQKLSAGSRNELSQVKAQYEALQVHAGLQKQRLSKQTSELQASEEKCIRLQRDFASFKANKLREVRMLKVSSDEWLDNEELPVLNKKVAHGDIASEPESDGQSPPNLDLTQPIIASELDIPSLAESELPDSVEELEFELVEDDEQS